MNTIIEKNAKSEAIEIVNPKAIDDLSINLEIPNKLIRSLSKYTQPKTGVAIRQMFNSFLPFVALWILMYISYDYSVFITFGLGMINAFFLVRIFIIQHDCGHRSFLKSNSARNIIGFCCSMVSMIPYKYWAKSHHVHHANNGMLELRDIGDINTLTVTEYTALTKWGRFKYKVYRSPLVMFVIGPLYYILIHNRLPLINLAQFKKVKKTLIWNNLALIAIFIVLALTLNWWKFFVTHAAVMVPFAIIAIWFFYVQHQHEEAYKEWKDKWDYVTSALRGSSYYKVPKLFNWLTGNIGIHHVHHLNPAIPNYNLKQCINENPWLNKYTTVLGFWESLKLASHKLWDEKSHRMITFKEFRMMEQMGMAA